MQQLNETPPSKLKPNIPCWIKRSIRPENQGLVIETSQYLGYYKKGQTMLIMGEHYIAYDDDHFWFITNRYGSIVTQFGRSKVGYSSESWLVPILPDTYNLGLVSNEIQNYPELDDLAKDRSKKEKEVEHHV